MNVRYTLACPIFILLSVCTLHPTIQTAISNLNLELFDLAVRELKTNPLNGQKSSAIDITHDLNTLAAMMPNGILSVRAALEIGAAALAAYGAIKARQAWTKMHTVEHNKNQILDSLKTLSTSTTFHFPKDLQSLAKNTIALENKNAALQNANDALATGMLTTVYAGCGALCASYCHFKKLYIYHKMAERLLAKEHENIFTYDTSRLTKRAVELVKTVKNSEPKRWFQRWALYLK